MTTAYLETDAARELGATLPPLTTLLAKSDADLAVLLYAASLDLDAAMPYQGVRYEADQQREFPRYQRAPEVLRTDDTPETGAGVWDWDGDVIAAVVPQQVKIACLYQAASLLDPGFQRRLEAIRSGLASQSVGSMSESYLKPTDLPGGLNGLCDKAQRLMDRYRLRTAPML